jgi:hypothetical protein
MMAIAENVTDLMVGLVIALVPVVNLVLLLIMAFSDDRTDNKLPQFNSYN